MHFVLFDMKEDIFVSHSKRLTWYVFHAWLVKREWSICIFSFIRLLLFSWQKRELIGRNGKAGIPAEKFDFCVRNHGPLIIIVISVVPLSKLNKICQKKKRKKCSIVFCELQRGLILTFIYFYLLTGPFFLPFSN